MDLSKIMGKRVWMPLAVMAGLCAAGMVFAETPIAQRASKASALPARTAESAPPPALSAPAGPPVKNPAPPPAVPPALTPGQVLYRGADGASAMDPLSWSVLVHKSRHELIVYYEGHLYASYRAVFGRNPDRRAKAYADDRRTPEGVYEITKKYPSRRFQWFLKLNYPNFLDRMRYHALRVRRIVPLDGGGRPRSIGGAIGIHGTDAPALNEGLVDWTTGCVSVSNAAIAELAHLLPVGTTVIIKP